MASDEEKLYYASRLEALAHDIRHAGSSDDWDTILFQLDVLYRQMMMLGLAQFDNILEMIVEVHATVADQVVDNNPVGRPRLNIPMAQLEYFLGKYR